MKEILLILKIMYSNVHLEELDPVSVKPSFISSFLLKIVLKVEYGILICEDRAVRPSLGLASDIQIILSFFCNNRTVCFWPILKIHDGMKVIYDTAYCLIHIHVVSQNNCHIGTQLNISLPPELRLCIYKDLSSFPIN